MVSKHLLEELKVLVKEDYGVDLPDDLLSEFGNALVQYFETLTKINAGGDQNG